MDWPSEEKTQQQVAEKFKQLDLATELLKVKNFVGVDPLVTYNYNVNMAVINEIIKTVRDLISW